MAKIYIQTTEDRDQDDLVRALEYMTGQIIKKKHNVLSDIELDYQFKNNNEFVEFCDNLKVFKCFVQCTTSF